MRFDSASVKSLPKDPRAIARSLLVALVNVETHSRHELAERPDDGRLQRDDSVCLDFQRPRERPVGPIEQYVGADRPDARASARATDILRVATLL